MKKEYLDGENGYKIPCLIKVKGDEKKIAIVIHGFSGSKVGPTGALLLKKLPPEGIGVVTFDLPQHGESPSAFDDLRVDNCIRDIITVEKYVTDNYPDAEIYYFASSYGAYLTSLYISSHEHKGTKAFFRSAAVNMPERFQNFPEEELKQFREQGWAMIDHDYHHPMKIPQEFVDDLQKNDLFELYDPDNETELFMVHSDTDEIIEFDKAKAFSEKFNIPLVVVHGADHTLSPEYAQEILLKNCIEFFGK